MKNWKNFTNYGRRWQRNEIKTYSGSSWSPSPCRACSPVFILALTGASKNTLMAVAFSILFFSVLFYAMALMARVLKHGDDPGQEEDEQKKTL